jgi:D-alanine-D-alanine ligase
VSDRVAIVLHDRVTDSARPDERDALVQAEEIGAALSGLGYEVRSESVGLDLAELKAVAAHAPALVFNLVESLEGEGRLIHLAPAVLEALGVPFTGVSSAAMMLTSNKLLAKRAMAVARIPTTPWIEQDGEKHGTIADGTRCIVKSVWEHASIGIDATSVVPARETRSIMAERKARLGGTWFAERFIAGREFNISVLDGPDGPEVLPLAEIIFTGYQAGEPLIVDYAAKWDPTSPKYHGTQRHFDTLPHDSSLAGHIRDLTLACWRLFDLSGYARVDFRIDSRGKPWVLEVNANPCLSSDAGFMAAAARAGLDAKAVVGRIVNAALKSLG